MTIEQYIRDRIKTLRKEKEEYAKYETEYTIRLAGICELQAILSKIEELGK